MILSVQAISANPLAQSGSDTEDTSISAESGAGLIAVKALAGVFATTLQNILSGLTDAAQYTSASPADLNALATASTGLNTAFATVTNTMSQIAASAAGSAAGAGGAGPPMASVGLAKICNGIVSNLLEVVTSFSEQGSANKKVVANLKKVQSSLSSFSSSNTAETNISAEVQAGLADVKALAGVFASALQNILAGITELAQFIPGLPQATLTALATANSGLSAAFESVTDAMTQTAASFAGVTTGSAGLAQICNGFVSNLLAVVASFHKKGSINNQSVVSLQQVQAAITAYLA